MGLFNLIIFIRCALTINLLKIIVALIKVLKDLFALCNTRVIRIDSSIVMS